MSILNVFRNVRNLDTDCNSDLSKYHNVVTTLVGQNSHLVICIGYHLFYSIIIMHNCGIFCCFPQSELVGARRC